MATLPPSWRRWRRPRWRRAGLRRRRQLPRWRRAGLRQLYRPLWRRQRTPAWQNRRAMLTRVGPGRDTIRDLSSFSSFLHLQQKCHLHVPIAFSDEQSFLCFFRHPGTINVFFLNPGPTLEDDFSFVLESMICSDI